MSTNPTASETAMVIDKYVRDRPSETGWLTKPLERSVGINAAIWEPWLAEAPAQHSGAVERAFAALLPGAAGRFGTHHITRANLVAFAGDRKADDANVALFVATQMWGSGTTNGRGPRYTAAALKDDRLTDMLGATRDLARSGDLAGAYRTFKLAGVGPSFFTKWFWSSTLDVEPLRRPLILDVRVIESINALGWYLRPVARRWADRYEAYVDFAHAVAAATPAVASAEHVEAMLFDRRPDKNILSWRRQQNT